MKSYLQKKAFALLFCDQQKNPRAPPDYWKCSFSTWEKAFQGDGQLRLPLALSLFFSSIFHPPLVLFHWPLSWLNSTGAANFLLFLAGWMWMAIALASRGGWGDAKGPGTVEVGPDEPTTPVAKLEGRLTCLELSHPDGGSSPMPAQPAA